MRAPALAMLPLLLALPTVAADVYRGEGWGVGNDTASVGWWDLYFVYVADAPIAGHVQLWHETGALVDFDLTLWKPGAADDAYLAPDEVVARSWTHSIPERIDITLPPAAKPYVVSVEPIHAQGHKYVVSSGAFGLTPTVPGALGLKYSELP